MSHSHYKLSLKDLLVAVLALILMWICAAEWYLIADLAGG